MKKIYSLIAFLMTLCLLLSACGSGAAEGSREETADASAGSDEFPSVSGEESNPAETAPQEPEVSYTRKELEDMFMEVAWAYANKGLKAQYNNATLGVNFSFVNGGTYLKHDVVSPEYCCDDTTLYSDCSGFIRMIYKEAFGEDFLGSTHNADVNCANTFMYATQQAPEIVLCRWKDDARLGASNAGISLADKGVTDEDFVSLAEIREFVGENACNLRPGDVAVVGNSRGGHTMIYAGNGMILHYSGWPYDVAAGADKYETGDGAIKYDTVEARWFSASSQYSLLDGTELFYIMFYRPVNSLLNLDDGDDDLDNDVTKPGCQPRKATLSRMKYPGLSIDRTTDIGLYNSPASGSEVTLNVKLKNNTERGRYQTHHNAPVDYTGLTVSEPIPEGTELVPGSITGGGELKEGRIYWTVDLEARKDVTLSYTVKVTAPRGSRITFDGGLVDDIPSNSITLEVSGNKLSDAQIKALKELCSKPAEEWGIQWKNGADGTEKDIFSLAEALYAAAGIRIDLPTLEECQNEIFCLSREKRESICSVVKARMGAHTGYAVIQLAEEELSEEGRLYSSMVVPGFVNGRSLLLPEGTVQTAETMLFEIDRRYFEPGDIFVNINTSLSREPFGENIDLKIRNMGTVPGSFGDYRIMICIDETTFVSVDRDLNVEVLKSDKAETALWQCFTYSLEFNLRPSLAYDDMNA